MLCLLPALVCWCVLLGLLEDLLDNLFRGSRCSGHLHHFGALHPGRKVDHGDSFGAGMAAGADMARDLIYFLTF